MHPQVARSRPRVSAAKFSLPYGEQDHDLRFVHLVFPTTGFGFIDGVDPGEFGDGSDGGDAAEDSSATAVEEKSDEAADKAKDKKADQDADKDEDDDRPTAKSEDAKAKDGAADAAKNKDEDADKPADAAAESKAKAKGTPKADSDTETIAKEKTAAEKKRDKVRLALLTLKDRTAGNGRASRAVRRDAARSARNDQPIGKGGQGQRRLPASCSTSRTRRSAAARSKSCAARSRASAQRARRCTRKLESAMPADYLVACACDEIVMPETRRC